MGEKEREEEGADKRERGREAGRRKDAENAPLQAWLVKSNGENLLSS